ncbi:hypothetical protein FEM48_Zijuj12G0192700 [Ziziphus jujuba var. spinosa]|uniref:Ubiquitin-like protease family profile domain-containing protein n=1 Tax=Ziziphus jujuba var. spinosa TaxID=714518 RepID=A0A978UF25_ZIZJJ|nr:hypothetical protein FEM48_Zijuj12G0192700 [Ziziphus jujuba var. spinosa]
MGALTSNHKRGEESLGLNHGHVSKKPRFSSSMQQSPGDPLAVLSSKSAVARLSRYPAAKRPLPRIHAPCRTVKFGFNSSSSTRDLGSNKEYTTDAMGNFLLQKFSRAKTCAFEACRFLQRKDKKVIELDTEEVETETDRASEDSSIEEIEVLEEDGREGLSVVSDQRSREANGFLANVEKLDAKLLERGSQPSSSSMASGLTNYTLKVESAEKMFDSLSLGASAYRKMLESVERRTSKLKQLDFDIQLNESRSFALFSEDASREAFIPLTEEEEAEVERALYANRRNVLVAHENSNIEITGEVLQCLRPGAWLNDEVINLYLELLKEREKRDPQKFLKCHFFNTFFYKKLISGNGYDYKSVRRWTTQRKLGYGLIECDKIFVPVHKEIHWCLAIINKKDKKFQYLDSLRGKDTRVMKILARYYVDEVKEKSGKDINVSSWKQEYVEDLPEQENGFDCGMFMIKYADFYSRGLGLCFNQEHMPYFRLRTAKEILRLRAD